VLKLLPKFASPPELDDVVPEAPPLEALDPVVTPRALARLDAAFEAAPLFDVVALFGKSAADAVFWPTVDVDMMVLS
jgi:hypothetical protein